MDNSMISKRNLLTPEKAATFIPILISSGISFLVIIFFVMPQYYKSNRVSLELNGLIKKKNNLDNLKLQYKIINDKFDKLNKEKLRITELISGKSKLDTLLAKLGEIAIKNNIEFTSIIPKKFINSQENITKKNNFKTKTKKKNKNELKLKVDPLLVEGTKKYEFDISFKTEYANLLSFLRELEFQDNVILIDDVNILTSSKNSNTKDNDNSKGKLEVNISMTFYGQI